MKPNFALALFFDGIALLHRAAGGWRLVGEAAPDADDLAGALAALRADARRLEDGPLLCKLVLPNDQVRYMSIETGAVSMDRRREAARGALEGATPYAVDELAFDISPDGETTHVAAVARESLEEAEAFAREHGFSPVSFIAVPGETPFLGEPFFGVAEGGDGVVPDGVAVVVIGPAEYPDETAGEGAAEPAAGEAGAADEPPADPVPGFASVRARAARTGAGLNPVVAEPPEPSRDAPPPAAGPAPLPPQETPADAAPLPPQDAPAAAQAPVLPPDLTRKPRRQRGGPGRAVPVPPPPASVGGSLEGRPEPAPAPAPAPQIPEKVSALLARRREAAAVDAGPALAGGPAVAGAAGLTDEAERLTIFGARGHQETGGRSRAMGLLLTALLLIFLVGIAAWAAIQARDGIVRLFGGEDEAVEIAADAPAADPGPVRLAPTPAAPEPAQAPALTDTDAAVLDALRAPEPEPERAPAALPAPADETPEAAEARYAATGIWGRAPDAPRPAGPIALSDLYVTSIDPQTRSSDALALPDAKALAADALPGEIGPPLPPGFRVALDARGFVRATPEGAVSPDGFTVFSGRPPVVPPGTPSRSAAAGVATLQPDLPRTPPRPRPARLTDGAERAQLGGRTRLELAGLRPRPRPDAVLAAATAAAEAMAAPVPDAAAAASGASLFDASRLAVADSLAPRRRPADFTATAPAAPTQVAAQTVAPRIPSSASVAREATLENALNLRAVNLIGVYGTASNRRALVRLPSGQYRKVQVGDRIDGGSVSAIGEDRLMYQKGGRNLVLEMPRG